MTSEAWLTILFSTGAATVVVSIINAIAQRRKLGAETDKIGTEATKVITDAASGVVRDLREDNARLRKENELMRADFSALERREDELETQVRRLNQHARDWGIWADRALAALHEGNANFNTPRPQLPG